MGFVELSAAIDGLKKLLEPLRGEPLSDIFRACGQVFEFGDQLPATNRRGEAILLGEFALKYISSDWRVVQNGRIVLGSSDYDEDSEFFDLDKAPTSAHDSEAWHLARNFVDMVHEKELTVESVSLDSFAAVSLRLSHGFTIESFASSAQGFDLWWFHNRRTDVSCLVGPSGVNWGESEASM